MKELISVVITTYKRHKELDRAIRSVLNQTYQNLEIIVVDDNAKDLKERKYTEEVVQKYENIRLIQNKKNLGGALSRNVGIKEAKGKYIAFLDDDDEFLAEKLEKQYNCYQAHKNDNVGLIYCQHYRVNAEGKAFGEYHNSHGDKPLYENMIKCIAATSLWFCPKQVLLDVGMFEDSPCKQDSILLLKILGSKYNIYTVPENLVYYYEYEQGKISGTKLSNIEGLKKYREWSRKYYSQLEKQEVKEVEYNFSKELITLYVINNMRKEAKEELVNLIKKHPLSKKTLISIAKYIFPNKYVNWLNRGKNNE